MARTAKRSAIGFVDYGPDLSVVQGCTRISPGCAECWAEAILHKVGADGPVLLRRDKLLQAATMRFPIEGILRPGERPIAFIASLGDLFHQDVPDGYLDEVFDVLDGRRDVVWYVSTKRYERAHTYFRERRFSGLDNVWLAFSVCTQAEFDGALPLLVDIPQVGQSVLCLEPLLEAIDIRSALDYFWMPWVIAGGMTGPNYLRYPWEAAWAEDVLAVCEAADFPFWFKQGRSRFPDRGALGGRIVHQIPSDKHWHFRDISDPTSLDAKGMPLWLLSL